MSQVAPDLPQIEADLAQLAADPPQIAAEMAQIAVDPRQIAADLLHVAAALVHIASDWSQPRRTCLASWPTKPRPRLTYSDNIREIVWLACANLFGCRSLKRS